MPGKLFHRKKKFLFEPPKGFRKNLIRILGYSPHKINLYQLALLHKSAAYITHYDPPVYNDRLEYLGDAILDTIVAEFLFRKFPDKDEGFLTQMRSKIVNRENLNNLAIKLGIGNLIMSRMTNENHKSIFGNALEALIGAIYIDKGYNKTRALVLERFLYNNLNLTKLEETEVDFKSRIIEWGQKNKKQINFSSFEQTNDENGSVHFVSHLLVMDKIIGRGIGNSKKEAEQNAAQQALVKIE